MSKFSFTPEAKSDLKDILLYHSQYSKNKALDIKSEIFTTIYRICDFPESGQVRDDFTSRPVRFALTAENYFVVYKATNPVQIIRIVSTYRNIEKLL